MAEHEPRTLREAAVAAEQLLTSQLRNGHPESPAAAILGNLRKALAVAPEQSGPTRQGLETVIRELPVQESGGREALFRDDVLDAVMRFLETERE